MYITNATKGTRMLVDEVLLKLSDESKMKLLLYLFSELNHNQINSKNEVNTDLVEDDDMIVFNLESLGFNVQEGELFLRYNVELYNYIHQKIRKEKSENSKDDKTQLVDEENLLVDDGYVVGLDYSPLESMTIKIFEKLSFSEKIDFIAEIMIRYDNRTYFTYYQTGVGFTEDLTGFDIARRIMEFKKEYLEK